MAEVKKQKLPLDVFLVVFPFCSPPVLLNFAQTNREMSKHAIPVLYYNNARYDESSAIETAFKKYTMNRVPDEERIIKVLISNIDARRIIQALAVGKGIEAPTALEPKWTSDIYFSGRGLFFRADALFFAIAEDLRQVTKFLIDIKLGKEPDRPCLSNLPLWRYAPDKYLCPLSVALATHSTDIARFLINCGLPLKRKGWSALHDAIEARLEDIVCFLIDEKGMDPNETIDGRTTPLLVAIESSRTRDDYESQESIITVLAERGANVHAAVPYACGRCPPRIICLLLQLSRMQNKQKESHKDRDV